jgi:hypothetical protein
MMDSDPDSNLPPFVQQAQNQYRKYMRQYQYYLDRTTPHVTQRWLSTVGIYAVFMLRVVFSQGVSLSCFTLGSSRPLADILLVVYRYVALMIERAI